MLSKKFAYTDVLSYSGTLIVTRLDTLINNKGGMLIRVVTDIMLN